MNNKFFFAICISEENLRLKELVNMQQEQQRNNNNNNSINNHQHHHVSRNNNTNDDNSDDADMENCAILGVHLPQPTEYEYLRNILFEFMIGREPVVSIVNPGYTIVLYIIYFLLFNRHWLK